MQTDEPATPDEPDRAPGSEADDRPDGAAGDRGYARWTPGWPIPPALSAGLEQMTRAWTANLSAVLPSISRLSPTPADWAARLSSAVKFTYPVMPSMPSPFDAISQSWRTQISEKLIPLEIFRPLLETFERLRVLLPPNWRNPALNGPRRTTVITLANAGYPVCWVPRAEVLMALDEAEPGQRPQVLVKFGAQIVEDCLAVLDQVTAADLVGLATRAHLTDLVIGRCTCRGW